MGNIFKNKTFKTIMSYLLIIVLVILIRIFFIDPVRVDGGSMDTTLANGQIMILNKIVYKRNDVKRYDIVVVNEGDKSIIKRVIGLPGETIEYKDNKLYIMVRKLLIHIHQQKQMILVLLILVILRFQEIVIL